MGAETPNPILSSPASQQPWGAPMMYRALVSPQQCGQVTMDLSESKPFFPKLFILGILSQQQEAGEHEYFPHLVGYTVRYSGLSNFEELKGIKAQLASVSVWNLYINLSHTNIPSLEVEGSSLHRRFSR